MTIRSAIAAVALLHLLDWPGGAAPALAAVETDRTAAAGMTPVDIAAFLIAPDRPSVLRWSVSARGASGGVPYVLRDYAGRTVATSAAGYAADGCLEAPLSVPRGFYEITFSESRRSFGVLAVEPHAGEADPFFGVDAGLSWLEPRPALRVGLVAALKRSGIACARERMSVGDINPAPEAYDWQGRAMRYADLRRAYREAGVEVLELIHGEPGHFEPGPGGNFAQNLVETARTWSMFTAQWGAGWAGGEVGNEPDLARPGLPGDQYVVMAKAAAYAADHAVPHRPVVGGVFASVPRGSWYDACAANGLVDTIDALSFHQYDRAPAVQGQVQICRDYVAAAGRPGLPLWLTECGHPWVLGPDRPPRDQDADSAREITAKAVEARACGVARFFPFVLPFYEEGGIKSFSMFGREVTPLRSFAAYAWCASALSGCAYLGDLRSEDARVRLARVFGAPEGDVVAVLYTDAADPLTAVRLPVAPLRITGADGRILQADAAGRMPVPDGLGYAWFARGALGAALRTETQAARLLAAGRAATPARAPAPPVVLQFPYRPAVGQVSKRAYHVDRVRAAALPITVRLQNLGEVPLTITATLHLPGAAATAFIHAPKTVGAHALAEVSWSVDASAALDCCEERLVRITATCDQAPGILPLALPFLVEGGSADILARFPRTVALPIAELARWQVRVGGGGTQVFSSPDGHGWRMDLAFTRTGDAWAYPYFTMPKAIDPATSCGVVVRGRVLKPGGRGIMLMLVDGGYEINAEDLFVPDGQWHSVYVPFDQLRYNTPGMQNEPLHSDRVTKIAVGLGSTDLQQAMEVSDLILVGGPPGKP